jgi:hypothetical protein
MWISNKDKMIALLYDKISYNIHALLFEDLINQTFFNQNVTKKPTSSTFIDDLKCHICKDGDKSICSICLLDCEPGDNMVILPCGHQFHANGNECPGLFPWLKDNNSCPMCKDELPSNETINVTNDVQVIRQLDDNIVDEMINNILMDVMNREQSVITNIQNNEQELIDIIQIYIRNTII